MSLPKPVFPGPAEPFLAGDESICDPTHKVGVESFADFVLAHQGGGRGRTVATCGPHSGHSSGRAWDWMVHADRPDERTKANELIEWLLADGAELFRRAGLSYIIWNKRIWGARSQIWKPYDGYDDQGNCTLGICRNSHTDHVHFSFNVPGGNGDTSFYAWLNGGQPTKPAQVIDPPSLRWDAVIGGFAAGFLATVIIPRTKLWQDIHRKV